MNGSCDARRTDAASGQIENGGTGGPRLDISVVSFRSAKWIDGFMQSLLGQRMPLSAIRLLVRDNGSTDDTCATWRRWMISHGPQFAAFELEEGDNIGFGRGHNANLARSATPWMLVTNVDLEFEPDTIECLLERAVRADPRVASWECRQKPFEHPKHYHPVTGETLWSSSACILFRTEALHAIGGYEPRIFLYGEDVEISYRLRDRGWILHYVPRAVVWHHTYSDKGEVKPAQFLGSCVANVLLRLRYGSTFQAVQGLIMYISLFLIPARIPSQRRELFLRGVHLIFLSFYFLATRKQSNRNFPFRLWDYEFTRHGAFHPARQRQDNTETSQIAAVVTDSTPKVSVIVRTMAGRRGRLLEALASVAQQTYRLVELVLVEDGSETARSLASELADSGDFLDVRYVAIPKSGRCAAGNAGLALASGSLICFLDDDDLIYADHLETLVEAFQDRPEVGAVYGLAFEVRTDVHSTEPWRYTDISHSLIHRQVFQRAVLWHHNFLPIQTVLFRRELYEVHGGFDVELNQLEDWNLWVRYSIHTEFLMVDKVTSLYRVPARSEQAADRQKMLDEYYAIAVAKHSQIKLTLSPSEVLVIAQGFAQSMASSTFPTPAGPRFGVLRRMVTNIPGFRSLFYPLRGIYRTVFRRSRP